MKGFADAKVSLSYDNSTDITYDFYLQFTNDVKLTIDGVGASAGTYQNLDSNIELRNQNDFNTIIGYGNTTRENPDASFYGLVDGNYTFSIFPTGIAGLVWDGSSTGYSITSNSEFTMTLQRICW